MENVPGTSGTPSVPANKDANVDPTDDTGGNETISLNDFKELKSTVGKLFGTIRALQKSQTPPEPKVEESGDVETKTQKQLYAETQAQLKKIQEERKAEREEIAKERRENAIKSTINSYGLDEDNADLFEAFVLQKHGSAIKVEGKQVVYEDPETGEKSNVKDFIGSVYKSKGDKFKPPATVPNGRGFKNGSTQSQGKFVRLMDMAPEERAKLTESQRTAILQQEWRTR